MELTVTLSVAGAALLFTAFAAWKSGRPRKDSLNPGWISWRLVVVISGAVVVLAVVHALNLAGFHTGANQPAYGPQRP